MYRVYSIGFLFLTISLFSVCFAENDEGNLDVYEKELTKNDEDVVKFIQDGWKKLRAAGRTRGASRIRAYDIYCARVQVIDDERRYTILVKYDEILSKHCFYCYILVWTKKSDPLVINCYFGDWRVRKFI